MSPFVPCLSLLVSNPIAPYHDRPGLPSLFDDDYRYLKMAREQILAPLVITHTAALQDTMLSEIVAAGSGACRGAK
jgi:hypothetical protein